LSNAALTIEFGQRVALVGPNGSGKTTLFRAILNHANWEAPDIDVHEGPFHIAGRIRTGKSAIIGDYSQIHGHSLDESATLLQWFLDVTNLRHEEAAKLLHRFLFSRDDLERTIGTLSGGEKSRLQLARLVHEGANFLMLDEPTNHLDIQACEQLEEMLDEFEGTLLIISHDRYFLDKLVNRVIELKDCGLQPFTGTFAEWWQEKHQQAQQSRGTLQLHSQKSAAARRSESAQAREELKAHQREQHRMKNQLKQLEARIEKLETKQAELELSLAEAFSADGKVNAAEAQKLHTAFEAVKTEIAKLYGEWEALAAAVE
jgi:ATP-binding cassette subfamily F protein 3